MKTLSNHQLSELCNLLSNIEMKCKEYSHIADLEPVKRIMQIAESNYQKADNILTERSEVAGKDLHYSKNR